MFAQDSSAVLFYLSNVEQALTSSVSKPGVSEKTLQQTKFSDHPSRLKFMDFPIFLDRSTCVTSGEPLLNGCGQMRETTHSMRAWELPKGTRTRDFRKLVRNFGAAELAEGLSKGLVGKRHSSKPQERKA